MPEQVLRQDARARIDDFLETPFNSDERALWEAERWGTRPWEAQEFEVVGDPLEGVA